MDVLEGPVGHRSSVKTFSTIIHGFSRLTRSSERRTRDLYFYLSIDQNSASSALLIFSYLNCSCLPLIDAQLC